MYMYMYIYISIFTCIYLHKNTLIHIQTYKYICIFIHIDWKNPPPRGVVFFLICFHLKRQEEEDPPSKILPYFLFLPFLFLPPLQTETYQKENPYGGGGFCNQHIYVYIHNCVFI